MSDLLKNLTVVQLKQDRPDLIASIQNLERSNERFRILTILKYYCEHLAGNGLESMLTEAVQNGWLMNYFLQKVEASLKDREQQPAGADKTHGSSHLDRARAYQNTHGGSIAEALKATAPSRATAPVKIEESV